MKLLLDENLSRNLVAAVLDEFAASSHVVLEGLESADDVVVWEYARAGGFAIVSKDRDFLHRSILHGHPPKIVWVRLGNCSTRRVLELLRRHAADLRRFDADAAAAFLELP